MLYKVTKQLADTLLAPCKPPLGTGCLGEGKRFRGNWGRTLWREHLSWRAFELKDPFFVCFLTDLQVCRRLELWLKYISIFTALQERRTIYPHCTFRGCWAESQSPEQLLYPYIPSVDFFLSVLNVYAELLIATHYCPQLPLQGSCLFLQLCLVGSIASFLQDRTTGCC